MKCIGSRAQSVELQCLRENSSCKNCVEQSRCLAVQEASATSAKEFSPALQRWAKWVNIVESRRDDRVLTYNYRAERAMARAAMAAVSARKIVSPREAAIQPAPANNFSSSSAQPPSGPTAIASDEASCVFITSASVRLRS